MSRFSSKKDRDGGDKPSRPRSAAKGDKKSDYKAKRSFTKNKGFRENKPRDEERPRRSFDRDKPFKKSFGDREERPRKTRDGDEEPRFRKKSPGKGYGDSEKSSRSYEKRTGDKSFGKEKRSYRDSDEKPKRTYDKSDRGERPARKYSDSDEKPKRSFDKSDRAERPARKYSDSDEKPKRSYERPDRGERPARKYGDSDEKPKRSYERSDRGERPARKYGDSDEKPKRSYERSDRDERPAKKYSDSEGEERRHPRGYGEEAGESRPRKSYRDDDRRPARKGRGEEEEGSRRVNYDEFEEGRAFSGARKKRDAGDKPAPKKAAKTASDDGLIRLNKYLSNAGIASRREADTLIQSGAVKVNGVVVDQLGYKIKPGDKVSYGDEAVKGERKVYLLLNKPKDYITTVDDPRERKTVMELIQGACRERVYPVGRLDRNTTGLLLFTNDGELTTKLTHPRFGVKKVYHVSLNKGLKTDDFRAIIDGVELEDGPVKADDLAFVGEGKKEIGIEIHSGRNRVVRRLFEHLGYDVLKLDRVTFAGLSKKDLPRGKYRFLTAKEISFLKMLG